MEYKTVLIAGGHELTRKGLRMLLEANGGRTRVLSETTNYQTEIKEIAEQVPDVVIMLLPGNEMKALSEIRLLRSEIIEKKVIAISCEVTKKLATTALGVGVKGFLVQDSSVEELHHAIDTVAAGSVYITPKISPLIAKDYEERTNGTSSEVPLPMREKEVLKLGTEGKNTKQIASILSISTKTVEAHRANVMKKLNCRTLADLIKYAIREGIADL